MSNARPRPRPRPRPVAKASSPPDPSSSTQLPSSPGKVESQLNVEDEDALFMRNRSRTAEGWKRLEQLTKETEKSRIHRTQDESDDEQGPGGSSPGRKHRKKSKADHAGPEWTRTNKIPIILSSDEDSDSSGVDIDIASTPKPKGKRKRERSRSRSITPPPALPIHMVQNARNLVRQALDSAPRPASPTGGGDDSADNIMLDPELVKIVQEARNAKHSGFSASETLDRGGGPETVVIKVKWRPHPMDEAGARKVFGFKIKRHDAFRDLFEETADLAAVLSDNLVISYEGRRLFPSATPHSLRIWAEAELEACDKRTYEYMRANRHQRSPSLAHDHLPNHDGPSRTGSPSDYGESGDSDREEQDAGDKFKLILRSAATKKDITLTVRQTTTCGAIVKAFLKSAGLADKYPAGITPKKGKKSQPGPVPVLIVDGEKMGADVPIGDADLEDGDLVEVGGL